MLLRVDTRLFGQNHKAGDEVELNGVDADRLESRRIVEAKPAPSPAKPKKQPKKEPKGDIDGS